MKVAVYCSAKDRIPEEYLYLGDTLGKWIAESGHTLVYGGATGGLMTRVSNAAKAAGGIVEGVIPQRIIQAKRMADNCDTLYVVTGAVFRTVGGNESVNTTSCRSDSGKQVAIPNYYYKALLQLQIRGGVKSYQAIALWVPHTPASGAATMDDAITIDRLEELTGYDFFPNLDPSTEASVESTIDNRFWGL